MVKRIFPKNGYQLRDTLLYKLDLFKIPESDEKKFYKSMASFDFEPVCVQEDKIRVTDTITWIGKHDPKPV